MTPLSITGCDLACRALLRIASVLVPRQDRTEWLQEWTSELWYARQRFSGDRRFAEEWQRLRFCTGAFKDASWLAQAGGGRALSAAPGSVQRCMLGLVVLFCASLGMAAALPQVRCRLFPSQVKDAQSLMLIAGTDLSDRGIHTLPEAQYEAWRTRRQHIFEELAFYRVSEATIAGRRVRVAFATRNLFHVVGLPVLGDAPLGSKEAGADGLILGRELWRLQFGSRLDAVGRTVHLSSGSAVVAGVAPFIASSLPGNPDLWVLTQSPVSDGTQRGFVLGRVQPAFREGLWGDGWRMSAPLPDGSSSDFTCRSLQQPLRQPWDLYVFSVLLALVALPATTSLPLGEYHATHSVRGAPRLRRWSFLLSKTVLILGIVYGCSLDIALGSRHMAPHTAEYLQLVSSFAFCLYGFRWILRDQRQRCPVCLGTLSHPARVGQPSRSFLAWNGTELICAEGHGLLHVPEISTSWFSTQRWLYLDPSWQVLFPERSLAPTHYF